jgi:starch synthase
MRVLHVATEVYPWVKTGGLADVVGALPPALIRAGVDARLFLPGLPGILDGLTDAEPNLDLGDAFGATEARVLAGRLADSGVPAYVLDAPGLFDRPGNPYLDENQQDYSDNHRRFALLGWAAARFQHDDWQPDVVHAHDWHAGLVPAWQALAGAPRAASVFTVHNLAFQGLVPAEQAPELGLPSRCFNVDGIEFHGQASFMKAGLYYADRLTTVSPTYATEIQSAPAGVGLEGLLAGRGEAGELVGILNGVDVDVWNPATDTELAAHYDVDHPRPKARNKAALQRALGLADEPDAPLFCLVSRLTEQKGIDLVVAGLDALIAAGGQLALLGSGEPTIEAALEDAAARYPQRVSVTIGYDEALSHRLIGSADFILVPSRYEPCGLTQLYGLRYGTLPVVTQVGGLADTVIDATEQSVADGRATGIVLADVTPEAMDEALRRAIALYRCEKDRQTVSESAMRADFSWQRSAARYIELYRSLLPAEQTAL